MELSDILKEIGDEKAAVISAAIETEKTRGIDESRKKGAEIKKWMTEANGLKDKIKAANLDPENDIVEQISSLTSKSGAASGELEKRLLTLQKTVDTLKTERDNERVAAQTERTKRHQTQLSEILRKEIGEKIHAADHVIKNLILEGKVKLDDDEKPVWIAGDESVPLDKGAADFLKSNPALVRSQQSPGSGSSGTKGQQGGKVMKREAFEQLTQREKANFIQQEKGTLVD